MWKERLAQQPGRTWVVMVGLWVAVVGACEAGGEYRVAEVPLVPLEGCPEPICPPMACPPAPPVPVELGVGAASSVGWSEPVAGGPVELNTATLEELMRLPGVGRATAERIMAQRARRPFKRVRELMRVKGIGPGKFRRLEPMVTVSAP